MSALEIYPLGCPHGGNSPGSVVMDPLLTQRTRLSCLGCIYMGLLSSHPSTLQSPESGNHPENKKEEQSLCGSLRCHQGPTHVLSGDSAPWIRHPADIAWRRARDLTLAQEESAGCLDGHTDTLLAHAVSTAHDVSGARLGASDAEMSSVWLLPSARLTDGSAVQRAGRGLLRSALQTRWAPLTDAVRRQRLAWRCCWSPDAKGTWWERCTAALGRGSCFPCKGQVDHCSSECWLILQGQSAVCLEAWRLELGSSITKPAPLPFPGALGV